MENCDKNDRACFRNDCEANYLNAAAEASLFIESLDLNLLQQNKRTGRIYLEIVENDEKLNQLNRHNYAMHHRDPDYLFNILKSTGRLNCPQEMKKLKDIIFLKEKHNCLLAIKIDLDIHQQVVDFFSTRAMELPPNVFLSGGTAEQSVKQDPSLNEKKETTTEEILTSITWQLYERIAILKDPRIIPQLVCWVMHPNRKENEDKMFLGCMTNEFKCVMYYYKLFNKKISNAAIGRFGVFISQGGTAITADNLRNTSFKNLNTRRAIANIFAPYL